MNNKLMLTLLLASILLVACGNEEDKKVGNKIETESEKAEAVKLYEDYVVSEEQKINEIDSNTFELEGKNDKDDYRNKDGVMKEEIIDLYNKSIEKEIEINLIFEEVKTSSIEFSYGIIKEKEFKEKLKEKFGEIDSKYKEIEKNADLKKETHKAYLDHLKKQIDIYKENYNLEKIKEKEIEIEKVNENVEKEIIKESVQIKKYKDIVPDGATIVE